jgi:carbon-monoxide dehydrogenase small subunit
MTSTTITLEVNGRVVSGEAEPRTLFSDFLRHTLGLHGTHVGCEHGVCGACTVLVDGQPTRACLVFAVQLDGAKVTTVEGLATTGDLTPLQAAFQETHALQCGFCTPGILTTLTALLRDTPMPSDDEIRDALAGNLCRCTGYQAMIEAVRALTR